MLQTGPLEQNKNPTGLVSHRGSKTPLVTGIESNTSTSGGWTPLHHQDTSLWWNWMVNGLHLYRAFIQSALQLPHIHPFIHRRRCQTCKVTTNTSGAGRVRWRLAQGHLDTLLGGGGARGSNQQPSCCQTTALTSWAKASLLHCFLHTITH